jgi:hypothetical protein
VGEQLESSSEDVSSHQPSSICISWCDRAEALIDVSGESRVSARTGRSMVDELHGAIADGEISISARPLVIYAPIRVSHHRWMGAAV